MRFTAWNRPTKPATTSSWCRLNLPVPRTASGAKRPRSTPEGTTVMRSAGTPDRISRSAMACALGRKRLVRRSRNGRKRKWVLVPSSTIDLSDWTMAGTRATTPASLPHAPVDESSIACSTSGRDRRTWARSLVKKRGNDVCSRSINVLTTPSAPKRSATSAERGGRNVMLSSAYRSAQPGRFAISDASCNSVPPTA